MSNNKNRTKVAEKLRLAKLCLRDANFQEEQRTSRRGVPHLVVYVSGGQASVCYFAKTDQYRVYHPYPSQGIDQDKWTCDSPADVAERIQKLDAELMARIPE